MSMMFLPGIDNSIRFSGHMEHDEIAPARKEVERLADIMVEMLEDR